MDAIILRFLISTIVVSVLVFIILLLKKIVNKHMSKKTHYNIWYFLFILPITAFLPLDFFRLKEIYQHIINSFWEQEGTIFKDVKLSEYSDYPAPSTTLLHDFTISINKSTPDFVSYTFSGVWVIGLLFFLGVAVYANYQINQIKKTATAIKDQKINDLLKKCKETVGVKKEVILQESSLITSPITLGLWRSYILLPKNTQEVFSFNELKYVFLHELSHQKNNDVFVNYGIWLLQMIYWFNPLIWYAIKRMRLDRELACDASVLKLLDKNGWIEYGHTIIHFADKISAQPYQQFASEIGGTQDQIKQRIRSIVDYSGDSALVKWKGKAICVVLGIFVLLLAPLTSVIASADDVYHFSRKNTVYEDLSSYFNGYTGSFVLYDPSKKHYQIYNREMSEQRISPNSTYKIYSALFALEENVISPNNHEQIWDGTVYPYEEWNTDQNLSTAMSRSVNWYFQNVDKKMGRKKLQYYIDKIKYGNENVSGKLGRYWMESSLKISPIEQVELLHAFEENTFGFKEESIRTVKKSIFINEKESGQLYGKTGTGTINGKNINGWFIGFVEQDDHTYYFAMNIQNKNGQANGSKAADIATQILKDKHIY